MTAEAPRRRRRSKANERVTIYWRDIPAQVTAKIGGEKGSWVLEARFEKSIDNAATIAGLTAADDYVQEWRRVSEPCEGGDPEVVARTEAERLQDLYPRDRLRELAGNGGLEPDSSNSPGKPS